MTVSTTTRKQTFAGGQTTLTFTFRALSDHPEYIKVKRVIVATGVESDLVYNTDFTVSVDADGVGGTVTLTPTFSTASNIVVYRETALIQDSDYDDFNQFPADTLEEDLDREILINQEQSENIARSLLTPISSTAGTLTFPSPDANKIIGWDSTGTTLENKTVASLGTVTIASSAEAIAATNNTNYMTPYLVKLEVQNPGSVLIPEANILFNGGSSATFSTITVTSATITNITSTSITTSTLQAVTITTGTLQATNIVAATATIGTVTITSATITTLSSTTITVSTITVTTLNYTTLNPTISTSGGFGLVTTVSTATSTVSTSIPLTAGKRYRVVGEIGQNSNDAIGINGLMIRFNGDSTPSNYRSAYYGSNVVSTSTTEVAGIATGMLFAGNGQTSYFSFDIMPKNGDSTQVGVVGQYSISDSTVVRGANFGGGYDGASNVTSFTFNSTSSNFILNILRLYLMD